MRDRPRLPPLSVAARSAVAAGLIGAVLALGFTFWLRHTVYTERYEAADEQAVADIYQLLADGERRKVIPNSFDPKWGDTVRSAYQTVDSNGTVLRSPYYLAPFTAHGPLMGIPPRGVTGGPGRRTVRFGDYEARGGCARDNNFCTQSHDLAGRRIEVWHAVRPARLYDPRLSPQQAAKAAPDEPTISVTTFVLPHEAELAVAQVDKVLAPAMPAAVALLMLGAYVATRLSLRPVDRMRAEAARISAQALHRRLPEPRSNDAVGRLAVTLNETLDRLERSADQQARFIADAAHELRSPIASLRTVLEVAQAHPGRADWQQVVSEAVSDTHRLQELADDLLLVARLDADRSSPAEPVDLAELARRHLAQRLTDRLSDRLSPRVDVTFEAAAGAPVLGNRSQLDRLLRNLVDNAVRHARSRVAVSVRTAPGPGDRPVTVLRVSDDGPGIPVADRERVFERFTRLDEGRDRAAGGVGLGLAISREIATRHGATLTVADSPPGGATLVAEFPSAAGGDR